MPLHRGSECIQVVTPLQTGQDTTLTMASRDPADDAGQGSVSLLCQPHAGQGIVSMSIKSSRDQHKVGLKRVNGRYKHPFKDLLIVLIALPGREI